MDATARRKIGLAFEVDPRKKSLAARGTGVHVLARASLINMPGERRADAAGGTARLMSSFRPADTRVAEFICECVDCAS